MTAMYPDGKQGIIIWWNQFIDSFRESAHALSEQSGLLKSWKSYFAPTQIVHVWITKPAYNFAIVTHYSDLPDREIIVQGPFNNSDLSTNLDSLLRESRWARKIERKLPPPCPDWASSLVAGRLSRVLALQIRSAESWIFNGLDEALRVSSLPVTPKCSCHLYVGDITSLDPKEEGSVEYLRDVPIEKKGEVMKSENTKESIHGMSTFFFPPIAVDSEPVWTDFNSLVSRTYRYAWSEKVLDQRFMDVDAIVERNGRITLTTKDVHVAERIFNTIFGVASLRGITAYAVRQSEISEVQIDADKSSGGFSKAASFSTRGAIALDLAYADRPVYAKKERQLITRKELSSIVDAAATIFIDKDKCAQLISWFEANTFLLNGDYDQAFVTAWVLIERWLYRRWYEFPEETRKKYRRQPYDEAKKDQTSVSEIIYFLSAENVASGSERSFLSTLNWQRNQLVHKGASVTKESATSCVLLAKAFSDLP